MRLTLFLTRAHSLRTWHEQGTFDRELALYRRLHAMGVQINIVSYGGRDEYDFASQIPEMNILANWINWSDKRYEHRLHQLHGWRLWQSDVFKSNQLNGAEIAVKASKTWRKPLIVRFGFLWSAFAKQNHEEDSRWVQRIEDIEKTAIGHAKKVVMTSELMLPDVLGKSPEAEPKVTIIPNYVDTDGFCPIDVEKTYDLVFIGRVAEQKNLHALLTALRQTVYSLAIVGDGELKADLQQEFSDIGERVHWLGRVEHQQLPQLINQAKLFVLPSHYEGHPKSLIEAMACGLPIIGTRVRGIEQVIEHGENGYLCENNSDSIRQALDEVLSQPQLMDQLGTKARQFALEHYSLDRIAHMEYALLQEVVKR